MTTLRKESVALLGLTDRRAFTGREERCHVFGNQCGPYLLVVDADLGDAFDEWDERHGERIDFDDERDTLANLDWTDRNTIAEAVDIAMSHGEVRCTGSGTYVYVDPYEWVRSFRTPAEAGRFFRSFG